MIGIGITTRNRSYVFNLCIQHFAKFAPKVPYKLVVVDDNSDVEHTSKNKTSMMSHGMFCDLGFEYIRNEARLGIAGSKNVCLRELRTCGHIFLFDDDCWPISDVWYEPYCYMSEVTGNKHFLYGRPAAGLVLDSVVTCKPCNIEVWNNCGGMFLYLTKEVLEKVGAFDEGFNTYGYEHCDYTRRIHDAGLTPQGKYLSLEGSLDHIYSIDFDLVHLNRQSPTGDIELVKCSSSLDADNRDGTLPVKIKENFEKYKQKYEIYIPL